MSRIGISSIINGSYLKLFGSASSSSSASSSKSDSDAVSSSVTGGISALGGAITNLNAAAGELNLAHDTLEKLSDLTGKIIKVVEKAAKANASTQTLQSANREFRKFGQEYRKIVEGATSSDRDALSSSDLKAVFQSVGLDSDTSDTVASVFQSFVLSKPDHDLLADEQIKGKRPTKVIRSQTADQTTTTTVTFSYYSGTVGTTGTYNTVVSYAAGTTPTQALVSDVNSSGTLDLITVSSTDNSINVLSGNGDGTFAAKVSYYAGVGPQSIQAADFSKDGKTDVVSFADNGASNASIGVLIGNSNGSFQAIVTYATVHADAGSVEYADVNGDGSLDIITSGRTDGQIGVLLGNGNGTFQASTSFVGGSGSTTFKTGDVNNDGKLDIIALSSGDNAVNVLLGNGNGSFAAAVSVGTVTGPTKLVVGDITADGKLDIAVTSYTQDKVFVFAGNGNATFRDAISSYAGDGAKSVSYKDVNEDGLYDLVVASELDGKTNILYGNGDGSYVARVSLSSGTGTQFTAIADLNRDGLEDFFSVSSSTNNVGIILGNRATIPGSPPVPGSPDGTFLAPISYSGFNWQGHEKLGDVNGDGRLDIIGTSFSGVTYYQVLLSNSDGTFLAPISTIGDANNFTVGDFNGDGKADVAGYVDLSGDGTSGEVRIRYGTALGTFSSTVTVGITGSLGQLYSGEFNGDGKADIVADNSYDDSGFPTTSALVIKSSGGTFTQANIGGEGVAGTGDVDNDGDKDIFFFENGGSTRSLKTAINNGSGSFTLGGPLGTVVLGSNVIATSGDFNNDNKLDLVYKDVLNQTATVFLGNGNNTFLAGAVYTGFGSGGLSSYDLNNDGYDDLLTGVGSGVDIHLANSNGTFNYSANLVFLTGTPSGVVAGDFNGDGAGDLVANAFGAPYVLLGNISGGSPGTPDTVSYGTYATNTTTDFTGGGGFRTISADINQDGILDAVTAGNTNVTISLGNIDGTFRAPASTTVTSWRGVDVADFNRDGKLDIVASKLDGTLDVSLGNGDATFSAAVSYATSFSWSETVRSADLNGDGKLDLVASSVAGTGASVLLGNGNGTFQASASYNIGAGQLRDFILKDVNQDGRLDIIGSTGATDLWVYLGNSNGSFQAPTSFTSPSGQMYGVTSGDYDKDGKEDILVSSQINAEYFLYRGNGNGTFQARVTITNAAKSFYADTIDLNNDGNLDLVSVALDNTGDVYNGKIVQYSLGNGNGTFKAAVTRSISNVSGFALADFNSDGVIDILAENFVDGNVRLFKGTNTQNGGTGRTQHTGSSNVSVTIPGGTRVKGRLKEFAKLFDGSRSITDPSNAYRVLTDLKALKEQIDSNIQEIEGARGFVSQNVQLITAVQGGFRNVQDRISSTDDADKVASKVADYVQQNARQALTQLPNLNPITVKALLSNE